ncbi:Kinesin-like protein [Klebsormidium nitens]|uniref:Kinesin-like protein n=1 Tax=Klebsormidium nitens TaxID=105231 RepID=A0A1Y1HMR1_KLENI|nr:Kinesin-like protein [Klebsormidium nitens]|eukprot:GAQ79904.1 Kinesin-like protein [Klebsormidium nitens]
MPDVEKQMILFEYSYLGSRHKSPGYSKPEGLSQVPVDQNAGKALHRPVSKPLDSKLTGASIAIMADENANGGGKVRPRNLAGAFAGILAKKEPSDCGLLETEQQKFKGGGETRAFFQEVNPNLVGAGNKGKCQKSQAAEKAREHDARRRQASGGKRPSIGLSVGAGVDGIVLGGLEREGGDGREKGTKGRGGKPPRSPVGGSKKAAEDDRWQQEIGPDEDGRGSLGPRKKGLDVQSPKGKEVPSAERRIKSVRKWKEAVSEVLGEETMAERGVGEVKGRGKKRSSNERAEGGEEGSGGKRLRLSSDWGVAKGVGCAFSRQEHFPGFPTQQGMSSAAGVNAPPAEEDTFPGGALVLATKAPRIPPLQFHPGSGPPRSPPARLPGFKSSGEALAVYPKIRPSRGVLAQGNEGGGSMEWVRQEDDTTVKLTVPEGTEAHKRNKKEATCPGFTHVFGPESTQEEFFRGTTAGPVGAFLSEAKSCVVWAFGMTAAGKSYTMVGSEGQRAGLIPRAMDSIFASLSRHPGATVVTFSVIENQNDRFYDLLVPPQSMHGKRQGALDFNTGNGTVKGAREVVLRSAEHGKAELRTALANRHTERTDLNASSSRSHAIFSLRLGDPGVGDPEARARLCFVDLAGSERLGRTHNEGDRLHESRWINSTLTTIFQCIKATGENQEALGRAARLRNRKPVALKPVPCRDSRISYMFREELSGRGNMILALCLSPDREDFDETMYQLEKAKEAAKIRIFCEVEAVQQPWSLAKAPRQPASPAVRYTQDEIARRLAVEDENQRLRQHIRELSARVGGAGDERAAALADESERLRQQVTSLEEALEEARRAHARTAEQTEISVRREVVAEFKAALEARKTVEDAKLARAIEAEQRKYERQLARLQEEFTRAGAQATPPSARARRSSAGRLAYESAGRTDGRLSLEGAETGGTSRVELDGEREEDSVLPGDGLTLRLEPEPTELTEPLASDLDAESDGEVSQRTVRRSDGTSDGATEPLPEEEPLAPNNKLERDEQTEALAVWQERCRQLEETVAALQRSASTAEIHEDRQREVAEGHVAECDVTGDGDTEELPASPPHEEEGGGEGDVIAGGGKSEVGRTSAERRAKEERTRRGKENGEENGGELEALREEMDAREARHSDEMREAQATVAALQERIGPLQERIAELEYAIKQNEAHCAAVHRVESDVASERAADVIETMRADLQKGFEEDLNEVRKRFEEDRQILEMGREEESAQAETDAQSLRMEIQMLEDQLERQREETDKLNARYQNLLSRVNSSPPKSPKPRATLGFALPGPCASPPRQFPSPKMSAPSENRALSLTAPSPGFSSPLGRAISAAVNKHPALEAVHTGPVGQPAEPVGLGLIAQEAQCEEALGMESPTRRSMLRSPFTLLLNSPIKSPGLGSPSLITRSPSFAFLAANRSFLPTPQLQNGAHLHCQLAGGGNGDKGERRGLREAKEEVGGSPAFNRERSTGGKRGGSASGDERARARVSFAAEETKVARESREGGLGDRRAELERRDSEEMDCRMSSGTLLAEPGITLAGEEPQRIGDCPSGTSKASLRKLPRVTFSQAEGLTSAEERDSRTPPLERDEFRKGGTIIPSNSPDFCPLENADDFPAVSPASEAPEIQSPLPPVQSSEQSRETAFFAFSLRATTPEVFKSVSPGLAGVNNRSPFHTSPADVPNPALTRSSFQATRADDPKRVSPVPNGDSDQGLASEPESQMQDQSGRARAMPFPSRDSPDAGQEPGVSETNRVNGPVVLTEQEEDPADLIQRLPPFERGRQRRAALFTPLRPVPKLPEDGASVNEGDGVKEEDGCCGAGVKGKRVNRGPIGQLLEETVGVPLPSLLDAVGGQRSERLRELVAQQGGALDIAHYQQTQGLRLSADKQICLRYCFTLLSERWRDPSSGALFPLEKRKDAAAERIHTFGAVTAGRRGGVGNVAKGARVKRVEMLTPRLKRQTRAASRRPVQNTGGSSEKTNGKQRARAKRRPETGSDEASEAESSSEEDESDEQLTSPRLLTSTCFPGESPYVHSGAKKVVPIGSVNARGSPEKSPESASPVQEKAGTIAESGDLRRPGKAPAVLVDLSAEGEESDVAAGSGGHVAEREAADEAQPAEAIVSDELRGLGVLAIRYGERIAESGLPGGDAHKGRVKATAGIGKKKRPRLQPIQRIVDLEEALGETDGSPVRDARRTKVRKLGTPVARRTRNHLRFFL